MKKLAILAAAISFASLTAGCAGKLASTVGDGAATVLCSKLTKTTAGDKTCLSISGDIIPVAAAIVAGEIQ